MKFLYWLIPVFALLTLSCENPFTFKKGELSKPSVETKIDRTQLMSGDSFITGYLNGNIRSNQISFNWARCTDSRFVSYALYMNNNLVKKYSHRDSLSIMLDSLSSNTSYSFKLITLINTGMTSTDTLTIKTPNLAAPDHLTFSFSSPTNVKIKWRNNFEAAKEFVVFKNQTDSFVVYTNYLNDVIDPATTNTYKVKAKSNFEETAFSSNAVAQYIFQAPHLNDLILNDSQVVQLSWTDASTSEDGYRVYRSENSNNPTDYILIAELPSDSLIYYDNSPKTIGSRYYYYIQNFKGNDTLNSNIKTIVITDNINLFFDFEDNNGGFTSDSWQYGIPAYGAYSGSKVWGVRLSDNYSNSSMNSLYMPVITLKDTNSTLSFYHYYNTESSCDFCRVQISTDNGNNWVNLYNSNEYSSYTGYNGGWTQETFNLNQYNDQTIQIRFLFSTDGSVTNSYGWLIDNVSLISN